MSLLNDLAVSIAQAFQYRRIPPTLPRLPDTIDEQSESPVEGTSNTSLSVVSGKSLRTLWDSRREIR